MTAESPASRAGGAGAVVAPAAFGVGSAPAPVLGGAPGQPEFTAGSEVGREQAQRGAERREEAQLSAQLARRAAEGVASAFTTLVELYQGRIYQFLRQWAGNDPDAEDLAQECFLKAYLALRRGGAPRAFAPWLFTIARRTAISHFRSLRPTEALPSSLAEEPAEGDPAERLQAAETSQSVWRLVDRLKPKQREALWLRYAEGFTVEEVAQVLGTNRIHVRVLLHRARAALLRWMEGTELAEAARPARTSRRSGAL